MIKLKAPKDMTAMEFVAHLEILASREMLAKNLEGWSITLQGLRKELSEPAPNQFTPDQLASMRECQRGNWNYAAMDENEVVFLYETAPSMDKEGYWEANNGCYQESHLAFLSDVLCLDKKSFICFADYAPLEGK